MFAALMEESKKTLHCEKKKKKQKITEKNVGIFGPSCFRFKLAIKFTLEFFFF